MGREQQKIGSIKTFIERLEALDLDNPSDSVFYFRGHSDHEGFSLVPSIYREKEWIENEHRMFREIIMKCPNDFVQVNSSFEKLVRMQHYSLPTRLLDLTANPLAALFFAVNENPDKDAEVLIFRIPKKEVKYYDSDTVSIISSISRLDSSFRIPGTTDIDLFNTDICITDLLNEVKKDNPYFKPYVHRHILESVVCVKPKLDNPRIIRQDGAFFVFGIKEKKAMPASVPDSYRLTTESYRLIINKAGKAKILGQLATLGINEATMYPEIDTVSKYIKQSIKNELTKASSGRAKGARR
ncbi:MAG: FRG domain-containing protein [Candidatus Thiodiazotropha sp. (ex Lucinoma borealis)]|nr:FRG domain-containing protein [Candidatus Thiodiazotropha sp. (ex Lucinoma borealis)]